MRVIVCGGRHFRDRDWLFEALDYLDLEYAFDLIINGGAPGADKFAEDWAKERGCPYDSMPANWERYRNAAGPIRNKEMLDKWRPHLVVAFPGAAGTTDMIKQARSYGVEVIALS